jgi:hypothetical protein
MDNIIDLKEICPREPGLMRCGNCHKSKFYGDSDELCVDRINHFKHFGKDPCPREPKLTRCSYCETYDGRNGDPDASCAVRIDQFRHFGSEDEEDDDIDDENPVFSAPKSKNSVFELNLAEFPIAMLSKKAVGLREYTYSDTITGRNDERIKRTWTIKAQGTDKKGKPLEIPGPATLQVIFELFQLWNQQGFKESKITIGTYHQFLKRLGWETGKSGYERLKYVIECIHGLHISCQNAFYLKKEDVYINKEMYLFPSMGTLSRDEIPVDDPNARFYIRASEDLYKTMKKNNKHYMPISREHFKELTPMEQKLSMILSKYFSVYRKKQRRSWSRKISELADQLPIMSKDNKKIRHQLRTICDGLIEKNSPLLSKYALKDDSITFFNNIQTYLQFDEDNNAKKEQKEKIKRDYLLIDVLLEDQIKYISKNDKDKPFFILVAKYVPEEIIFRCISTAKQEAKDKVKLYTYMILHEAEKYIRPHLRNADTIYLKSNENFSDSDVEEINKECKPVALDYYIEKDKGENLFQNEENESEDSVDPSLQLELDLEEPILEEKQRNDPDPPKTFLDYLKSANLIDQPELLEEKLNILQKKYSANEFHIFENGCKNLVIDDEKNIYMIVLNNSYAEYFKNNYSDITKDVFVEIKFENIMTPEEIIKHFFPD